MRCSQHFQFILVLIYLTVDSVLFQSAHWRDQLRSASLVPGQGVHEAVRGQVPDVQVTRQEEEHQHPGDHPVSVMMAVSVWVLSR